VSDQILVQHGEIEQYRMEQWGAWNRSENFARTAAGCIAWGTVEVGMRVDKRRRQFAGW